MPSEATTGTIPELAGILTADQVVATAKSIADLQRGNGQIPWFPDGHTDAWNHVENAMALDTAGFHDEATLAYRWLADIQRDDGSWHQYYLGDAVKKDLFDANTIAYIATGVWHHHLLTADRAHLLRFWPVVERAVDWVLALQRPQGDIVWARHPDGTAFSYSLLTGSSSIQHSLRCAFAIASELGHDRQHWLDAAERVATCIRTNPSAFAPKDRWAMDWYYPVLTGAMVGDMGRERLVDGWNRFVIPGNGVRCVADQDWVTSAETCEAVMAHLAVGETERALELFTWAQVNRDADGAYFTGLVIPQNVHFPAGERSTYTAAAIVLAADALAGTTPASRLLWDPTAVPHATLPE